MDLCRDKLAALLPAALGPTFSAETALPKFRRLVSRIPGIGSKPSASNADRLFNRFWTYPRFAQRIAADFDCFHVVDQSYSQIIHHLPADLTGVYCHDLDFARSLLEPEREPRPQWYRAMAGRILSGFRKAAIVFHSTLAVRDQILSFGLIDSSKLVHAPLGVSVVPKFVENVGEPKPQWYRDLGGAPCLLHVGSCIPRKRIDVLLSILGELKRSYGDLKLLKAGAKWTADQNGQIEKLGIRSAIVEAGFLSASELGMAYRNAAAVLVPSEAEGFGLPVIEALASGAPVIASDIPALREAGGNAALYCPVGDIEAWSNSVRKVLAGDPTVPGKAERIAWASRFTWESHAEIIAGAYCQLLS